MATKLAETNTEVRHLAILDHTRSSYPEANYLDVFNSSSWSSHLVPWDGSTLDCAFRLPRMSTNDHNTSACSEASSLECIDVALESHEEVKRGAKTVPKRQIQLKRRDTADLQTNENNNDMLQVPSTPSRPRDMLQRQHSTPATFHQDSYDSEPKSAQKERKQRLQKSLSLDETSGKAKMASCLITTILSKRMQHEEDLRAMDVCERASAPMKAYNTTGNNECLTSSAKDVCSDIVKVSLVTGPLVPSSQSPIQKTETQTDISFVTEHICSSSKAQTKVATKHSFNSLLQGRSTEITASPKREKEKLCPSKEVAWLTSQSPGQKLSCDSAKGKAWNSSAAISRAIGKKATVKTTPEECYTVQGGHKQHNAKTDPITSVEKQEKQGEAKESSHCPMMAGCLAYDIQSKNNGNVLSQPQSCPVKEQESESGDSKLPGQSVNMGIQSQGKFKAIAPVHVVRDMRSLVKNTYNLSFRGPGEPEDYMPEDLQTTPHHISSKGEDKGKGYRQDEKLQVRKVTPPLALDRIRDLASLNTTPRGCATKASSLLESYDKTPSAGFTKVRPVFTAKANSCALLNSLEAEHSQLAISQVDVQANNNTDWKQTKRTDMTHQANKETSSQISKNGQPLDSSNQGYEICTDSSEYEKQPQATAPKYSPPAAASEKVDSCKPMEPEYSTIKHESQTPGPPPRSQSTGGPPPACILTVAPTPVLPPYYYKPSTLGYQTVSPHMGAVSYVQGPVLLYTQAPNQPATATGPIPLMRSLSEEVRLLSQPSPTDGNTEQGSSKEYESGEIRQKMPSPDTQQCPAFVATLGTEVIRGSAGILYAEMNGGLAQSPRHLLLDPETGRCFYVDMPQLPQRKMLFDPETCQYVEVLLPQQTLSGTVMPSPCAIPFPSIHIPAIYTPHCLPYLQAHPQVLPPPEP